MQPQTETGRFRIYTPHSEKRYLGHKYGSSYSYEIQVSWKPLGGEYSTRQKAIDEMNRKFKRGDAKVRKLPSLKPLTELQESVLAYLRYVGYDSCYSTLINSKYSIPKNRNHFMGGMGPMIPLQKRGLVAFKIGVVNPHRKGKRTCTVVALPWVHKYHDRFRTWPSPELIQEMQQNGAYKQSSD